MRSEKKQDMIAIQLVKFSEHIIVAIIKNIHIRIVHRDGSNPNCKSTFGGYISPSFSKDAIKLDICSSDDKSISWTVLPTLLFKMLSSAQDNDARHPGGICTGRQGGEMPPKTATHRKYLSIESRSELKKDLQEQELP